jgi:hypothetical protein
MGNDRKTNNETSAARQQILNKQIYAAITEKHLHKQTCSHGNNWSMTMNGVFNVVRAEML